MRTAKGLPRAGHVVAAVAFAAAVNVGVWLLPGSEDPGGSRADMIDSARSRLPSMLHYSTQDPAGDIASAGGSATPDFREAYSALMRAAIDSAAAQAQTVSSDADVLQLAAISSTESSGKVLAVVRQTRTVDGVASAPQVGRLVVTLERQGGTWLVDGLQPL